MKINPFTASRSFPKGSNTSSTKAVIFSFMVLFLFLNVSLAEEKGLVIPETGPTNKAVEAVSDLRGEGLIPCETSANPRPCAPKDIFTLLAKLGKLILYLIIIVVALGGIIAGAAYPYLGAEKYRTAIKKYGMNVLIALLVAALATTFVFALLKSLNFDKQFLNIIEQLFSEEKPKTSFNFIETSWAENRDVTDNRVIIDNPIVHKYDDSTGSVIVNDDTPIKKNVDLNNLTGDLINEAAKYDGAYTNPFGSTDPVELILKLINFLIKFIVIPALIFAILWTGFLYVNAQGNSTKLDEAHKWVKNCVIGILIAAAAPFLAGLLFRSLGFLLS